MKTFLKITGVILGLFVLSLVFIFVAKLKSTSDNVSNANKEAQAYVDKVIPEIVGNWDAEKLIDEASPELLRINSPENIRSSLKDISSQLGNLREYKGSEIYEYNLISENGKKDNNIRLSATSSFDKANAEFDLWLISSDTIHWQIREFNVKKISR